MQAQLSLQLMSSLRILPRPLAFARLRIVQRSSRTLATNASPTNSDTTKKSSSPTTTATPPLSSCPPNTILQGLDYLKGQAPVQALRDEEYPAWLWTILEPRVWPDDGPGGKAEKVRRRAENRQRIKDQNFMKTQ